MTLIAFLLSLFLTATTVSGYLFYRLIALLRTQETWTAGFSSWIGEIQSLLILRVSTDTNRSSAGPTTSETKKGLWSNGQGYVVVADEKVPKSED